MASYKYEVVGADGKPKTGTIEAMNMEVASAELKSGGNTIVSIARANAFNKDLEIHIGKVVSVREMSVFCRQFESVLNAGVTVVEALDMLSEQTENKPFANAIAEVRDSVQRGETLAVAMAEHPKIFPNLMVQMVAAGESSGGLDKAFSRVGSQFEKEAHLKGLIIKSAIYPVILIFVIIVVVAIMMIKIVPTFTSQFDEVGGKLPGITLAVMAVSDFFVHSWYFIIAIIAGIAIFIHAWKKQEQAKARAALDPGSGNDENNVQQAPIVKLLGQIIEQAVHKRASDIHIEPMENQVRIRFRVDGVLHEAMRHDISLHAAISLGVAVKRST